MPRNWRLDFKRLCERTLQLTVEDRMRYGFVYTYKPILDDAPSRSFESMEEYRRWCQANLPDYLGYGPRAHLDSDTLEQFVTENVRREIERRKRFPEYQDL